MQSHRRCDGFHYSKGALFQTVADELTEDFLYDMSKGGLLLF
jgi:hypothetical protein